MNDPRSSISNGDTVVAHFGYWPTFHDAEVLWIRLDRQASDLGKPPTLEVAVHAFEMTDRVDETGHYVLQKHAVVRFCFSGVVELKIDGFNHQNAILGLTIADIRHRQMEGINFDVSLAASYGVEATFQAENAEVVSVHPLNEAALPSVSPFAGGTQSRPKANL